MSIINKLTQLAQSVLDQVTGAELPKTYYDQKGQLKDLVDKLPQLRQKYRPTPWLSNQHIHLIYFDVIKKNN